MICWTNSVQPFTHISIKTQYWSDVKILIDTGIHDASLGGSTLHHCIKTKMDRNNIATSEHYWSQTNKL